MNSDTLHEHFRDLIALRLYAETDEDESTRLEAHLATCAACARYAVEIEAGLGSIPRSSGARADLDLPRDWMDRLRESSAELEPRRRVLPWWTVAASFAAGAIASLVLAHRVPPQSPSDDPLSTWNQFHRAEPPPIATTAGQLGRLSGYLRR
jgi:anti-sigma factor RsiW